MNNNSPDRGAVEARFAEVFTHLGFIAAYVRRRGSRDPDALAAEVMAIAWRRLADVPRDDARPWLIVTARNLLMAERRRESAPSGLLDPSASLAVEQQLSPELELDPALAAGLDALSDQDREALLLVAWEDLTPTLAAASLGITPTAFRMRLLRARRRLNRHLSATPAPAETPSPRPNWTLS